MVAFWLSRLFLHEPLCSPNFNLWDLGPASGPLHCLPPPHGMLSPQKTFHCPGLGESVTSVERPSLTTSVPAKMTLAPTLRRALALRARSHPCSVFLGCHLPPSRARERCWGKDQVRFPKKGPGARQVFHNYRHLNVSRHRGNASQNHSEMVLVTCSDSCLQKDRPY